MSFDRRKRTCAHCKEEYRFRHIHQKYCGVVCKKQHGLERQREYRLEKYRMQDIKNDPSILERLRRRIMRE